MQVFTIGFTQKSAETFFNLLKRHNVTTLVDTRLRPEGQLSGFAKGRDLAYFLKAINNCGYIHMPQLSPTDELLDGYRQHKDWHRYETAFFDLLATRDITATLDPAWWRAERACLLCSEHQPDRCHRRLVAEYLSSKWEDVNIIHITK